MAHKKGKIEMADGGTLFLDEIGEMPGELQVKLLRLIQQGEIEKVGATHRRRWMYGLLPRRTATCRR